jgi:hypothetical protein
VVIKKYKFNILIIPALGRLRQVDIKFKASLNFIVRPRVKRKHALQV